MKKLSLNLSSFIVIILFSISFSYSDENNIIIGKAIVLDGDTIKIKGEKIRFSGIDAPESFYRGKKQFCYLNEEKIDCANLSKLQLKEKIGANPISCEREKDKYSNKIQGREFGFEGKDTGYLGCMRLKGWSKKPI